MRPRAVFRSDGFTLLEIILAMVVLVLGVVPVVQAFSQAIIADQSVEGQTIALNLAQEQMEAVKNASSWANIDTYASAKSSLSGDFADYSREVLVSGNPKQVTVNVYWTFKGVERSVSLVSLFTNLSP